MDSTGSKKGGRVVSDSVEDGVEGQQWIMEVSCVLCKG